MIKGIPASIFGPNTVSPFAMNVCHNKNWVPVEDGTVQEKNRHLGRNSNDLPLTLLDEKSFRTAR